MTALALALAAPGLGDPAALVFDEIAYVGDAVSQLENGVATGFRAHPPLGSWLIAIGIAVVGPTPVGWRLVPLLLGVLAVPLVHRLALRLAQGPLRRWVALATALLLALDGSWFVLTRTAMLDGMLTTLVLAAVAGAVVTRERLATGRTATVALLLTGTFVGLATATKWSGALAGVITLVVVAPAARRTGTAFRHWVPVVVLGASALLVYAVSWVPFAVHRSDVPFGTCPTAAAPCADAGGLSGVIDQHAQLVRFHRSADIGSGYESDPAQWVLSYRPVPLWRSTCDVPAEPVSDPFSAETGCPPSAVTGEQAIVYLGNPLTWLLFTLLLPLLVHRARSGDPAARLAVVGWVTLWLPWLLVTRSAYLFYLAPAVPFMALGLATTIAGLAGSPATRSVAGGVVGAAAGLLLSRIPGIPLGIAVLGWMSGGLVAPPVVTPSDATVGRGLLGLTMAGAAIMFLVVRPYWLA